METFFPTICYRLNSRVAATFPHSGVPLAAHTSTVVTLPVGQTHTPAPTLFDVTDTNVSHSPQSTLAVLVDSYTCPQSPHGFVNLVIVLVHAVVARARSAVEVGLSSQAVMVVVKSRSVGTGESQMARQEAVGAVSIAQPLQLMMKVEVVPAIGGQHATPVGSIVVVQVGSIA